MNDIETKKTVQKAYGVIARTGESCCSGSPSCDADSVAISLGYSESELKLLPDGANLGLSCGNPTALKALKEGQVILDLGSGAGFDCFIAAPKVGPSGKVIGVDMTPEMVAKARENAKKGDFSNVEFRLGEIENLPVADNSVDVVISNCVINMSVDKERVLSEIVRVLKPGGRIAISDTALLKELPDEIRQSPEAYVGCVAGAILVGEYRELVERLGLRDVKATVKGGSSADKTGNTVTEQKAGSVEEASANASLKDYVVSIYVEGVK
jgi:arsenite methyltransferase